MADGWSDRAIALAGRHDRALSVAGAIWFWTGIAIYARFLDLPALVPEGLRPWFFWLSVAFNAGWWGYLHPQVVERKKALTSGSEPAEIKDS